MKRSNKIILMAALIGISAGSTSCIKSVFPITGNGHLVNWESKVSTFEKINSSGSAEIRFYASDEYRAVVTIDENLCDYVEVFTKNNALTIRHEREQNISPTKFLVDVYCPVISSVTMSGSGSFTGMDHIVAPTFETIISGSGKVEGTVECLDFSTKISGSGKITVDGTSKNTNISISGSGDFNGIDFCTQNATVQISGSGNVNIFVSDYLKANISGSGKINYRGDPEIDSTVSGSGKIRKQDR